MDEITNQSETQILEETRIILLPGLDGTGTLFKPLLEEIHNQRSIEIIRYPVNEALTYNELTSLVEEVIKNKSSIYLIAESFSGPIALKLLNNHKNKIKGIILVASFITTPRKYLLNISKLLPMEYLLKSNIPDFLIKRYCLGNEIDQEMINDFKKAIISVKPNVLIKRLKELSKLNKYDYSHIISQNIYYIQASKDKLVPNDCLKELSSIVTLTSTIVNARIFYYRRNQKNVAR